MSAPQRFGRYGLVGVLALAAASCCPASDAVLGSANPMGSCYGFAFSLASGVQGEPTPRAAVAHWLRTKPEAFDLRLSDWHPWAGHPDQFRAGAARVTVWKLPSPGSGYVVTGGSTC